MRRRRKEMRTVALAFSSSPSSPSPPFQPLPAATPSNPTPPLHHNLRIKKLHFPAKLWVNRSRRRGNSGGGEDVVLSGSLSPRIPYKSGFCMASQSVELFPSICPGVIVRDARIEDCWEVADTHCSSFFPDYRFPLDLLLRIDRFVAMLSGFSVPPGCMRTCLVAITGSTVDDNLSVGFEDFKIGVLEGKFSFNRGSVAGILTVDTVADFLPRKGPLLQRRTGIAYVSNVAVRETERRKGIAKRLVAKAEVRARSWGCRAIALHCDANSLAATRLYRGQGFKRIKVAERASWPQPKTAPGIQFNLMMKLLVPSTGRDSIDKR